MGLAGSGSPRPSAFSSVTVKSGYNRLLSSRTAEQKVSGGAMAACVRSRPLGGMPCLGFTCL